MRYTFYYRGDLSSCNYSCEYCPFSKKKQNARDLDNDKLQLERFVSWIREKDWKNNTISLLFIPWGEALIHTWYQEALIELSQMKFVNKAVVQTNLSCDMDWLDNANREKLALWTTYHPSQANMDIFAGKLQALREKGLQFSIGCVGKKEYKSEILALKTKLETPLFKNVYIWVNAYKDEGIGYYSQDDIEFFDDIDKYFKQNLKDYDSLGKECRTGKTVFFIEGSGNIRRCNFERGVLGNIYNTEIEAIVYDNKCKNKICDCYIGYINLKELNLTEIYGNRILERIPIEMG